ncbi:MAG: DUF4367 domain-containing protein [Actinomycetota bacterium]|nr:DUF4367 domain-containing protein [Actinomycetota bacterium]
MPDRERDLESELRELGSLIDYPPTPDVARAVRTRLDEENDRPRRSWLAFPTLRWAAVAAAFVLVVAVPTLSPGLRATVGGWLVAKDIQPSGRPALDAGSSEKQSEANAPAPGLSKSGEAASPARTPRFFGERITLREARARTGGNLLLPRTPKLGKPDQVYALRTSRKDGVVLVYGKGSLPFQDTRAGLVLTEVPGDIEPAYLSGKPTVRSELGRVMVNGDPGYWSPARRFPSEMDRYLPGNVLLWEQEGVALRLEADLPKEKAVRLAESVG